MLKSIGLNSYSLIPVPSLHCVENSPCFPLLQPREVAGSSSLCSKTASCGQFKDSFLSTPKIHQGTTQTSEFKNPAPGNLLMQNMARVIGSALSCTGDEQSRSIQRSHVLCRRAATLALERELW